MEPGFKLCPFCAEPIREAAAICRFCNRPLSSQPVAPLLSDAMRPDETLFPSVRVPITPYKPPIRTVHILGGVLAGLVILLVVAGILNTGSKQRQDAQYNQFIAGLANNPKPAWHDISRAQIVNQSLDLRGYYGWLHQQPVAAFPNLRQYLTQQSNASEPERVFFVVMDQPNFERMAAGYPPIVIASMPISQPRDVEIPYGIAYWFGYVEIQQRSQGIGQIPTNSLGAAIWLLNAYERQVHPPIRMTAQVWNCAKLLGTDAEARKLIEQVRQAHDQQP